MDIQLLKELGLETAARQVEKPLIFKRKLAVAYEHFRFVKPEIMENFKAALKTKTFCITENCPVCKGEKEINYGEAKSLGLAMIMPVKSNGSFPCYYCRETGAKTQTYDTVKMTRLASYDKVPPMDCLMDLKKAKDLNCFDGYEVAEVESVIEKPDPIIFGKIIGCADLFFVTQWDNDIKIEDILKSHEG